MAVPPTHHLCFILTRDLCEDDPIARTVAAVRGGADCVQVREPTMSTPELLDWARGVKQVTDEHGVQLVVNDDADVALALEGAGLHLGQTDLAIQDARALLGPKRLLGLSTHTLEQLDEAADLGADYAGFGPIFATTTKGYEQGLGPEHLAAALAIARLPVLAIGGIAPENIYLLPAQCGVAVSAALCRSADPRATAQLLAAER